MDYLVRTYKVSKELVRGNVWETVQSGALIGTHGTKTRWIVRLFDEEGQMIETMTFENPEQVTEFLKHKEKTLNLPSYKVEYPYGLY